MLYNWVYLRVYNWIYLRVCIYRVYLRVCIYRDVPQGVDNWVYLRVLITGYTSGCGISLGVPLRVWYIPRCTSQGVYNLGIPQGVHNGYTSGCATVVCTQGVQQWCVPRV